MDARYWVVFMQTAFSSLDEVRREARDDLAAHIERSREWHADGRLLLAGAFLDRPDEPIGTMAVLETREDAEEFAAGDPFAVRGLVTSTEIRPWADILGT
jgi:uncharacterized protein YciI